MTEDPENHTPAEEDSSRMESPKMPPRLKAGAPNREGELKPNIQGSPRSNGQESPPPTAEESDEDTIEEESVPRDLGATIVVGMPEKSPTPPPAAPSFQWDAHQESVVSTLSKVMGEAQAKRLIQRTIAPEGAPTTIEEYMVVVETIAERIRDRVRRESIRSELQGIVSN